MRNENGYGSVIRLPGKRRRPFAVRVTVGYVTDPDGHAHQKQKYIAYFAKRSEAAAYLADYNRQSAPAEKTKVPTLKQVYDEWYRWKWDRQNRPGPRTFDRYESCFKKLSAYHDYRIDRITLDQLQAIMDAHRGNTKSAQTHLISIVHNVWAYALNHEYLDKDITRNLVLEYSTEKVRKREIFSDDEIHKLIAENASDAILLIFTGIRCAELCGLKVENIHEDYIITGVKTEAGKDRYIPIPPKLRKYIKPQGRTYYYENRTGTIRTTSNYTAQTWHPMMGKLGMYHVPHDCRHTCATLMERAKIPKLHRKLILGHKIKDLTEGVYTHVSHEDLMEDMIKITDMFL